MKVNSPDYKGIMTEEEAKDDFLKRIENYKLKVVSNLLSTNKWNLSDTYFSGLVLTFNLTLIEMIVVINDCWYDG